MDTSDETLSEFGKPIWSVGQAVAHYRMLQRLGSGGMGVVYKATDIRLGRTVALKFLSPSLMFDSRAKERLIREAQAAAIIDHTNVCTIYEVGECETGHIYIAMAYYQGRTVRDLLRDGPILPQLAIDISLQAAKGLARAHELGIIHRDIKPENIFLTDRGDVKVLDFGIAKVDWQPRFTREGVSIGTPIYMSPEQAAGEVTDQRSDIWSLGVVFYEMIMGRRFFSGAAEVASIKLSRHQGTLKESEVKLPLEAERILSKCMQFEAAARYNNARELAVELEELQARGRINGGQSRARVFALTAAILVGILACIFILFELTSAKAKESYAYHAESAVAKADRLKIAVLPFENLGPAEDTYFTDGVTEEITSRLATIPKLGVISRTSASRYKHHKKSMRQIGQELGVSYVLEGAVRWERSPEGLSRVLVTPKLIRVADDTCLWSSHYEGKMEEVFKLQSDIATQIIEQLNFSLVQPEWGAIRVEPTSNMNAYHAYLRGLAHLKGLIPVSEKSGRSAIESLEEAVQIDPSFALAYARLAMAQAALYHAQFDLSVELLAKAKLNAERALALQADLPEAHIALGYYHYWGFRAYELALKELSVAAKARPNNNEVIEALGYIKRRQGNFEESVMYLERAFLLDPRNPFLARSIGVTLSYLRRYEEAEKYYDSAIAIDPDNTLSYLSKASNRLLWRGSAEEVRVILTQIALDSKDSDVDDAVLIAWFRQELLEGRPNQALQRLASMRSDIATDQEDVLTKDLLTAEAYSRLQDRSQAIRFYRAAQKVLAERAREQPKDHRVRSALAFTLAGLGHKKEALNQARLAVDLSARDAFLKPSRLFDLALIYAIVGDEAAALDQIEHLLSIPSLISRQTLRVDPRWKPLRGNPRFEALIQIGPPVHRSTKRVSRLRL